MGIRMLVRVGSEDIICSNIKDLMTKTICFAQTDSPQMFVHRISGVCSYPMKRLCKYGINDRVKEIRYCKSKKQCSCKRSFDKEDREKWVKEKQLTNGRYSVTMGMVMDGEVATTETNIDDAKDQLKRYKDNVMYPSRMVKKRVRKDEYK